MKERQGHTQHPLKTFLHPPHPGAWRVGILPEELILSKGENRHQPSPGGAETDTHASDWVLKVRGSTLLTCMAALVHTPLPDARPLLTRVPVII